MAVEHICVSTLQPTAERGAGCRVRQGRVLSTAEILGLAAEPPQTRRALPLVLSAWIGLLLVVSDPLAGIATLFAAPVLLAYINRRQQASNGLPLAFGRLAGPGEFDQAAYLLGQLRTGELVHGITFATNDLLDFAKAGEPA